MKIADVRRAAWGARSEPIPPSGPRWLPWLLFALALVPIVWMFTFVRSNNPMQWHDYWDILPSVTNPDGSLATGNLFEYRNEHLVVIPSLVYWVNAQLAGGSNITLGYFVFLVAVIQVVLLTLASRETLRWPWHRAWLLVLFGSSLVLAPRGAHNFALAMSGTAWLTANLFAVLALLLACRRSPLLAVPAAVLASCSYGTGLMVWPALVVVALLQRRSAFTTRLLTASTLGAALVYYAGYERPANIPGSDRTLQGILSRLCGVLGSPFAETPDLGSLFGAAALVVAAWVLWAHWRRDQLVRYARWAGLLSYAIGGASAVALSRGGLFDSAMAGPSRYVSLGALAWISVAILAIPIVADLARTTVALGFLSLAVFVNGTASIASVRAEASYADELAIALRLGAKPTESAPYFNNDSLPILPALAHYPFNDQFSLDCGHFGESLDSATVPAAEGPGQPPQVSGRLESLLPTFYENALRVTGWIATDRRSVRCILLIDQGHRVVGAAALAGHRQDIAATGYPGATGFNGVILRSDSPVSYRAVAITSGNATPVVLEGLLPDR